MAVSGSLQTLLDNMAIDSNVLQRNIQYGVDLYCRPPSMLSQLRTEVVALH